MSMWRVSRNLLVRDIVKSFAESLESREMNYENEYPICWAQKYYRKSKETRAQDGSNLGDKLIRYYIFFVENEKKKKRKTEKTSCIL